MFISATVHVSLHVPYDVQVGQYLNQTCNQTINRIIDNKSNNNMKINSSIPWNSVYIVYVVSIGKYQDQGVSARATARVWHRRQVAWPLREACGISPLIYSQGLSHPAIHENNIPINWASLANHAGVNKAPSKQTWKLTVTYMHVEAHCEECFVGLPLSTVKMRLG